jgi:regulator of RNase E activity RraA
MDDLRPGDVAVLACNGPTDRIAPWGELLTTASRARGAEGCVTDGLIRDIKRIRELQFPVFHGGIGPLDSRGRAKMMDRDCRVSCGGASVRMGDWIFGDADGVVVVPDEIAFDVFAKSFEKVSAENKSRDDLVAGRLLREVFEEYGVL